MGRAGNSFLVSLSLSLSLVFVCGGNARTRGRKRDLKRWGVSPFSNSLLTHFLYRFVRKCSLLPSSSLCSSDGSLGGLSSC